MKVTIYHNPRCTKSRQALKLIEESRSHEPHIKLYLKHGLTREEVLDMQTKLGCTILEMMRLKEAEFKGLGLSEKSNEEQLLEGLLECPKLLERPVLIANDQAVIGRPLEKAEEFVKKL
tara:strand:+ start:2002 stop:2358 length:357 start_codon:yes stop_codon:yes gene_type:complete